MALKLTAHLFFFRYHLFRGIPGAPRCLPGAQVAAVTESASAANHRQHPHPRDQRPAVPHHFPRPAAPLLRLGPAEAAASQRDVHGVLRRQQAAHLHHRGPAADVDEQLLNRLDANG
jgi:hypothetical protein